jgi:6-phosphogluconolactonase
VTFAVDRDGLVEDMRVQAASGVTPFGFAFGRRDQVFVAEAFGGAANGSATSSYEIRRDGTLTPISPSVPTGQTAACWAALTPDGRFAFVTNTGSGSVLATRLVSTDASNCSTKTGGRASPATAARRLTW